MPDAFPTDAGSLSARAQEILRRADEQMAALRTPAPRAPAPEPVELPPPPAPPAPEPAVDPRPIGARDLGQLLDTVEAGISAARAHLVALSASLERIAEELEVAAPPLPEAPPMTLPPQLEGHATLPSEFEPMPEPEPEDEAAAPPPVSGPSHAAHDAARLVAIEMAVAGDTREGVRRRLSQEFGIRDPSGILDDAFGPDPGTSGRKSYGV